MNCKPGDVAYTVGMPLPELNGRVLTVVRAYIPGVSWQTNPVITFIVPPGSVIEDATGAQYPSGSDIRMSGIADKYLRPIRDQPGEDQMVTIMRNKAKAKT